MRILAVVFNVILLLYMGHLFAKHGMPRPSTDDFIFVGLILVTCVFSLWALLISHPDSWLGLYFRRKALEESMKIAELEKRGDMDRNGSAASEARDSAADLIRME